MSDRSKVYKKDNFLEESNSDNYILRFLSKEERRQYFRADLMVKRHSLSILVSMLFLETATN